MIFKHPDIICAFSRRPCNMSLVYGNTKDTLQSRREFLTKLGINYLDLVCAKQIHKGHVRRVMATERGRGALSYDSSIADTDALITNERNLPLAIFTADCLSVFLYDPKNKGIGLVHAGWRSTKENIVGRTIQLMQDEFNTEPQDLYVGFGPLIRQCCYEVNQDFKTNFSYGLIERNGRYYLDLVQINKRQLLYSGVKEENISDVGICTVCQNKDFFSYRKDGPSCGRMMSVMMLK